MMMCLFSVEDIAMTMEERKKFIEDIIEVYKKHNLSLSHEDGHGAFIVDDYDQYNIDWLRQSLEFGK